MNITKYRSGFPAVAVVAVLLMAGCASVISPGVLKDVDQSISFDQLLAQPEAYKGRTVLLGGDIIETQNFPDETVIVVLHRPLGFRKKPEAEGTSKGRFIVSAVGFLDPAIYGRGRKITVAGAVRGKEERALGEVVYAYPVIEKRELHLWPEEESSGVVPWFHFGIGVMF